MEKKTEFIITEEIIAKATDYIPLAEKAGIAKVVAEKCVTPVDITEQKMQSDAMFTLPQLYAENGTIKKLWLMQIFLEYYLHINTSDNFTYEEYDKYAKTHPMNQLERLKNVPSIKNKVYDILDDFKELKKVLDIEIYNCKLKQNDTVERILAGLTLLSTPENIEAMQKELEKQVAKADKIQERKAETDKKADEAAKQLMEKKKSAEKMKADTEKLREILATLPPETLEKLKKRAQERATNKKPPDGTLN